MKKAKCEDLRPEYRRKDLGKGIRGKYLKKYRTGTNLVRLKLKVAAAFPTRERSKRCLEFTYRGRTTFRQPFKAFRPPRKSSSWIILIGHDNRLARTKSPVEAKSALVKRNNSIRQWLSAPVIERFSRRA